MKNYFKDQKWNNYADIMVRNTHLWEGGAPSKHFLCLKARRSQGASTSSPSPQFTQRWWWRGSVEGFDVAELAPHQMVWPLIPSTFTCGLRNPPARSSPRLPGCSSPLWARGLGVPPERPARDWE